MSVLPLLLASCSPPALGWRAPAAHVAVDADEVAFGEVAIGDTASRALTLRNDGDADITLDARVDAPFGLGAPALRLGAGAEAEVLVWYRPTTYGEAAGSLRILAGDALIVVPLTGLAAADSDGDGFAAVAAGGDDCDDGAPDTHPGAPDDCYDDVDADCDGALDADCDGDGWPIGADCDDGDAAISPAAGEAAPDGVDDDCDGMIDETLLAPGDVFVSELHPDGSPWIELCSAAERDVPLDGLRLATGAGEHRLDAATLAAGACVAVCATEQDGCPLTVPGLALDAGDDLVSLDGGAVVLDAVHVTGWDREAFATWSLDAGRGAADNNAPEAWCLTEGTAGSPNPACP